MPQFSFVVPATRAHLLRYSIGSILAQSIPNFEVIICDNSGAADGELERVVRAFGDDRIRYLKTTRQLAHFKNWEFAHCHATGDWIILLADDDVVVPSLLAILLDAARSHPDVEILSWKHGAYVSETFLKREWRGRMSLPSATGNYIISDNKQALLDVFNMGGDADGFYLAKRAYPSPMQSAYKMPLVRRVRARAGALFMPLTPDWAAGVAAMACCDKTLFVDLPLTIFNTTSDSNAAGGAGDFTYVKQAYEALDEEPFTNVPFKGIIANRNCIADTIMLVRKRLPEQLGAYELNLTAYFKNVYYGLHLVRMQAGNVPLLVEEDFAFREVLQQQSVLIRDDVNKYMKSLDLAPTAAAVNAAPSTYARLRQWLSEAFVGLQLRAHPFSRRLLQRRLIRSGLATRSWMGGARDILEFAHITDRLLPAPQATQL